LKEVTATFVREVDHINYLTILDEFGNEQVIATTDSHPFWVVTDEPDLERAARGTVDENGVILYHENIDPGLNGFWVEAKDLREGDVFLGANGELLTLVSQERVEFEESITVYNFTVDGNHNYFVIAAEDVYGQTCVLVHNAQYGGKSKVDKKILSDDDWRILLNVKDEANHKMLEQILLLAKQNHAWSLGWNDCHRWVMGMRDKIVALGEEAWNNDEYEIQYQDWKLDPKQWGGFEDHGVLIIRFKDADGNFNGIVAYLDNRGCAFIVVPGGVDSKRDFFDMPLSQKRTHPLKIYWLLWRGIIPDDV